MLQDTIATIADIPLLEDRERKECALAVWYRENSNHGTSGHMSYIVIYKLLKEIKRLNDTIDSMIAQERENAYRS